MSVLTCAGLAKAYGDLTAVDEVSFEVAEGETYGLLGPNGAGKTTTISMIAGLLRPDRGEVEVLGRRLTPRTASVKASIGLVPQDLAIYPDLTARENLRFFGRLHGLRGDRLRARTEQVLEVTGLTDRADDRADEFSGGMKRRLNIGIGLLHEPKLLILDEPTVGVDPQSRNAILESVEQLSTEGMAVLYTTHYMEEAERLCDRLAIIDQGRIVGEGTRRQLTSEVGELDRVRLEVAGDVAAAAAACAALDRVSSADVDDHAVVCLLDGAAAGLPALLAAVGEVGATVTGVEVREPDLEDVFLHLTGRALRD
ncbi:ABC transporter ATP-binding protein [Nitriliruptor alkaliphilus]|uniref:ABC transporter ATP-binding protein n=1 Tax=Nitriliruptor alkaliphilus TaxID=427918 RepID=UPI000695C86F|nr:ABC transporter ATP-binding protein [Nitriliruptor alkaliphilus]